MGATSNMRVNGHFGLRWRAWCHQWPQG